MPQGNAEDKLKRRRIMNKHIWTSLVVGHLVWGIPLMAEEAVAAQDWQERRLLAPSERQLSSEQRGRVVIYDGLDERLVDAALDTQFGRMENMMFVGVRHTEPNGEEWEDDDCD
jgi:hypothetical protein